MFSLYKAKQQAQDKRDKSVCPEGKTPSKETCATCEQKQWCPSAQPSLEYVQVPDELKFLY